MENETTDRIADIRKRNDPQRCDLTRARDDIAYLLEQLDKQAAVVGKLRHWLDMQKTMVAIQPISVGQQSYLNCLDAVREYLDSAKVSDE